MVTELTASSLSAHSVNHHVADAAQVVLHWCYCSVWYYYVHIGSLWGVSISVWMNMSPVQLCIMLIDGEVDVFQ